MPRPASSAVDKALDIIEVVARADGPLRLTDLADRVQMHRATVYRVLLDLVRRGWVIRSGTTYLPGTVVLQLSRAAAASSLTVLCHPTLVAVSEQTSMMINLQVLEPDGARVIDVVRPERLAMIADLLGELLPVHKFAGPMALVAALDPRDRLPYLRAAELQGYPSGQRDTLIQEIERTRNDGFSLERGRNEKVIASIGRAVLDENEAPICALTAVGLDSEFDNATLDMLKHHLTLATADLHRTLTMDAAAPPASLRAKQGGRP